MEIGQVFDGVDSQAMCGLMTKIAIDRALKGALSDGRDFMTQTLVGIIKSYRDNVLGAGMSHGLVVPQSLLLLPLYVNAVCSRRLLGCRSSSLPVIVCCPSPI